MSFRGSGIVHDERAIVDHVDIWCPDSWALLVDPGGQSRHRIDASAECPLLPVRRVCHLNMDQFAVDFRIGGENVPSLLYFDDRRVLQEVSAETYRFLVAQCRVLQESSDHP